MNANRWKTTLVLVALLGLPVTGPAGETVIEAVGLVASTVRSSCGGTVCYTPVATNLVVDPESRAGVLVSSDEYFCSLGTRGTEAFAPGACRVSKGSTVSCAGSGSLAGEEWTSRLTLTGSGEFTYTKRWSYVRAPRTAPCSFRYEARGHLIRF